MVTVLLVATVHLSRADAIIIGGSFGYLLFTFPILWCFAERRLSRV